MRVHHLRLLSQAPAHTALKDHSGNQEKYLTMADIKQALCGELTFTHDDIKEGAYIWQALILPGCTFVQQNIGS